MYVMGTSAFISLLRARSQGSASCSVGVWFSIPSIENTCETKAFTPLITSNLSKVHVASSDWGLILTALVRGFSVA